MTNSCDAAKLIIQRFIEQGKAKGKRNYFGYVGIYSNGVIISREHGQDYRVDEAYLIAAIEAVRKDPTIYDAGPTRLHPYINRWIYSPLWALLRLVSLDELVK